MRKLFTFMLASVTALTLFAADETTTAKETDIDASPDAWQKAYGNVEFNSDSIKLSIPEDQEKGLTYITLKKPIEVKPGDVIVVTFKAKGGGGKMKIAGMGYHTSTGKKVGFRHGDKEFNPTADEFTDIECEIKITSGEIRGGTVEKTHPAFMILGKGATLEIKDIKMKVIPGE